MKKIALLCVLSAFSFNSFAGFALSCPEIYQRTINAKELKRQKVNGVKEAAVPFAVVTYFVAPTVGLPILVAAAGVNFWASTDSREQNAVELMEEGNRQVARLQKKLQKELRAEISNEEIIEVIREGLNSGEYCKDFPHLANRRQIKKHVTEVLSAKYGASK